ncbi:MAG: alanine racemase [Betaproteobacteria bacterium]|nr:alanine racemase [Betaproteobacteria bacterium]
MTRPLEARISASALAHNLALARQRAPGARVMAVIKANGYGHGLLRVAQALGAADGFAVLTVDEALALRAQGVAQPILLLEGLFSGTELAAARAHALSLVVHSAAQLEALETCGPGAALEVFCKINTGMNRLGFMPEALPGVVKRLTGAAAVKRITLMTHFACADEAGGIDPQLERFAHATAPYRLPRSLANSAALMSDPRTHGEWVRPGIMLYGVSPFAGRAGVELGLRPAMTLVSRVIAVQAVQAGERVGYGGSFEVPHAMRLGVVACGYADGYPRHAGTGTPALVDGRRTRLIGRVSMDMLCVDLTDLPSAGVGSAVTLWGEGLPVEEVAVAAGTIGYELLCALAPRVGVVDVS